MRDNIHPNKEAIKAMCEAFDYPSELLDNSHMVTVNTKPSRKQCMYGVMNYLSTKGFGLNEQWELVGEYLMSDATLNMKNYKDAAIIIQKDFNKFKQFVNQKLKQ